MEGTYGVYIGKQPAGKVQVLRQGLYYRFHCRCMISGNVMYRLCVSLNTSREHLGILVPMDGGFGLDTSIPIKKLGQGTPSFSLVPKTAALEGTFVPIVPEEPFAYLSRLKKAFLAKKDGQVGAVLQ